MVITSISIFILILLKNLIYYKGRSKSSTVILKGRKISKNQCKLRIDAGNVFISDCKVSRVENFNDFKLYSMCFFKQSNFGTWINKERIDLNERRLEIGDLVGLGENPCNRQKKCINRHIYSLQRSVCDVAKLTNEDENLNAKISSIILRLENETDVDASHEFNLISKPEIKICIQNEPTDMKKLEIFEEIIAELESKEVENYSSETKSSQILWDEIDIESLRTDKLYVKNFKISLEKLQSLKKLRLFQSMTMTMANKLTGKKSQISKTKDKNVQTKGNRKNIELLKNLKNVKPKIMPKPQKQKNTHNTKSTRKYNRSKQNFSPTKRKHKEFFFTDSYVILSKSPPILKPILVKKHKVQAEKAVTLPKKVSFCKSIFIRKFVIDSDSGNES